MSQWGELMANLNAARTKLDAIDETRFGDVPTLLNKMAGELDKAITVAEQMREDMER